MNDEIIGNTILLVVSFFAMLGLLTLLWIVFPSTAMNYIFMAGIVFLVGYLFFGFRLQFQKNKRNILAEVAQKTGLVPLDESYEKVAGEYCGHQMSLELVLNQPNVAHEDISLRYAHSTMSIENRDHLFLELSERKEYRDRVFENENEQFRARFSVNCKPARLCQALFNTPDLQKRLLAYHVEELTIKQNQISFKVLSGRLNYLLRLLDFLCDLEARISLISERQQKVV